MPPPPPLSAPSGAAPLAVALAASRGGVHALGVVLGEIPAGFPAALLVVLHCEPDRPSLLARVLAARCRMGVREARDGETARAGTILLAPPGWHLTVRPDRTLSLDRGARVHFARPAADPLFASLARAYGPAGAAVVLTGGGVDGTAGARAVWAADGHVLAQRPDASSAPGMPTSAIESGCVHETLALEDIASALLRFASPHASLRP